MTEGFFIFALSLRGKDMTIMKRIIRKAVPEDIEAIMALIETGKRKMRATGNLTQWTNDCPTRETHLSDMERGIGYVVEEDGRLVGTMAFVQGPDPTYGRIDGGGWLDDEQPYHVIHRIASADDAKGVLASVLEWCPAMTRNLRIDTHRDNGPMRHLLAKFGFTYCGIIYLEDGAERLAYQRFF